MKNFIKSSLSLTLMAITLAWSSNLKASTTISALQIPNISIYRVSQTSTGDYIIHARTNANVDLPTSDTTSVNFSTATTIIGKYDGAYWNWFYKNPSGASLANFGVDGSGDVYICGDFYGSATFSSTISFSAVGGANGIDMYFLKLSGSDGTIAWAKHEGSQGQDGAKALSIDANNNIYVGGIYSVAKGNNYVRAAYASKWTSSGTKSWSAVYSATDALCQGISSDASGNVYIVGMYQGNLTIGNTNLSGTSSYQVFSAKINSSGSAQWAKSAACDNKGIAFGFFIAADASGNVYTSGWYGRDVTDPTITKDPTKINFGNNITLTYSSSAGNHNFITKYNSSGTIQWAKKITGSNIGTPSSSRMFVSANNNLFILFNVSGNYNIAGTSYNAALGTFLITQLNSAGNITIIKPQAINSGSISGFLSPTAGGFIVSGRITGNVDLDASVNLSSSAYEGYIASYTDALFKTSGVNSETEKRGLTAFPNPAQDMIYIESSNKNTEVTLTDITGKVITKTIVSEGKAQIDLQSVKPGIYFLRAEGSAGIIKILKQ